MHVYSVQQVLFRLEKSCEHMTREERATYVVFTDVVDGNRLITDHMGGGGRRGNGISATGGLIQRWLWNRRQAREGLDRIRGGSFAPVEDVRWIDARVPQSTDGNGQQNRLGIPSTAPRTLFQGRRNVSARRRHKHRQSEHNRQIGRLPHFVPDFDHRSAHNPSSTHPPPRCMMRKFFRRNRDPTAPTPGLEPAKVILSFVASLGDGVVGGVPGLKAAAQIAIKIIEIAQVRVCGHVICLRCSTD